MNAGDSKSITVLRQKVEELLNKNPHQINTPLSEDETIKLIHELEVYQVELEMQNKELSLARSAALYTADKYAELYNFAPIGYFTLSKNGEIMELNLRGAEILGKERSRLINNRFGLFVSDDTRPVFNLFLYKVFTDNTHKTCEITLGTTVRSPKDVILSGIVIGNGEQSLVTGVDISRRKRTEEELRESEEKYRALFSNFLDSVAVHQIIQDEMGNPIDYIFLQANAAFETHTGLKTADIVGKRVTEVIPGVEKTPLIGIYGKVALTGEPITFEQFFEPLGRHFHISAFRVGQGRFCTVFQDITERRQTEEALRISEEKFRNIFEQSVVGKSMTTPDGKMKINAAFSLITGYSEPELANLSWQSVTHPDDIENDQKIINALVSGEKDSARWQKRYLHKNGNIVWADISTTLHRDAENKPLFFNTSIIDITQRIEVEEALRQSKIRLELAHRAAGAGTWDWDMTSQRLEWSEELFKLFGLDPGQATSTFDTWTRVIHPDDVQDAANRIKLAIKEKTPLTSEYRVIHPNGGIHWISAMGDTTYDLSGQPLRMSGICTDITGRKRAEQALRTSEERYRSLMTNLEVGIVVHAPDTSILMSNPKAAELLGLSEDQIAGRLAIDPEWKFRTENNLPLPPLQYPVSQVVATRKPFRNVILGVIQPTTNKLVWLTVNGFPVFDAQGEITEVLISFIDITERKLAEEALRLKNLVFDASIAANSISGLDGIITEANDAFLRQWGYTSKAEVIGRPISDFSSFDHESLAIITALNKKDEWEGDFNAKRKDGSTFIAHGLATTLKDTLGHVMGYQSAVIDITERIIKEEALRESEQKFRETINNLDEGYYSVNLEGVLLEHNHSLNRILGFDPATDLKGIHLPDFWQYPDERREYLEKLMDEGSVSNYLLRIKTQTGEKKSILVSAHLVNDKLHLPPRIEGIFLDITERIRIEESLHRHADRLQNLHNIDKAILSPHETPEAIIQKSLQHIRSLLSSQHASIGIFDFENEALQLFAANIHDGSIGKANQYNLNKAYGDLEILRLKRMEVVDDISLKSSTSELLQILQSEGIMACINVPLVSGEQLVGAMNLGWADPREFTPEELEIASEVADEITIAIEQIRLRQEAKHHALEMEQKIKERTSQLLAANKELEAFSYSVSHDLRAPLRHINGYIELLKKCFPGTLPGKEKHYLDTIADSAHQMGMLIDDLLQFSRTGQQEMHLADLDMNDVLREVLQTIKQDIKGRNIKWDIAVLPHVIGDYSLLRLVWNNLLSNAVKFTMRNPKTRIEIGVINDNDEFVFFVRDNGVGFDMKYAHKLFGVFQRLHSSEEFEGTGIGLANVRRIIAKHGGRTWAEADLDKGAVFYFSIPKILKS